MEYVYEIYQGIRFWLFPVGPVITGAMLGDTFNGQTMVEHRSIY